ncbi:hypothetical protein M3Y99_01408400 [Aphelenchoides fujianensis]|nr:hypothetical protein M3Y99_01408400 [Aphelenchoides fujianensis]
MTATKTVASALIVAIVLVLQTCAAAEGNTRALSDFYLSLPISDQEMLGQYFGGTRAFKRKSGADPNFLRFGKRAASGADDFQLTGREPNFLRFGKRADPNNNFLRFGRSTAAEDAFERENRKPNFLRFG